MEMTLLNTRPEGRVPSGKHRSHWSGVLVLPHNHLVSLISAAAEARVPTSMVADIIDMTRQCRAGMGPRGTGRVWWRKRRRRTWRVTDTTKYKAMDENKKTHVAPHDWAWLHRNPTTAGCSENM
ncbi:hypothetical protein CTI12_AA382470 [Artemisia annua]|uniref:Uncharacterized protein n=1 Tax=Artemisia annua TaxID=35608 RepID=A0A2U1MGC7_ARTAN|nr:hypothetical protein CTI12_AA382470 [Artemisia annua]